MSIREKAQELIGLSDKATCGPWIIDTDPRSFWSIYGQQDDAIAKISVKRSNPFSNEDLIVFARNHAPDIARKLNEALDVIKEMCDSAERYAAHANAHPERDHSAAMAAVAENVVTAGTLFLARLDEKGDADNA